MNRSGAGDFRHQVHVPYGEMKAVIARILESRGMPAPRAERCAEIFAQSSLDGVYTHGVYRVAAFVKAIEDGYVDVHAEPVLVDRLHLFERYDARFGPGMLNASFAMERAMELAAQWGFGIAALKNSNHWMRGGTYGWQAAEAGFIGICWTNTESVMPPWGAAEPKIGNNPLVIAVPRKSGPVVLDMAMSQFSTGRLGLYLMQNAELPVPGGFDRNGELTRDPAAVLDSGRLLPAGFWKGSGLSVMLDLLAALLAKGRSTADIDRLRDGDAASCYGCSQVFIAVDVKSVVGEAFAEALAEDAVETLRRAAGEGGGRVRYPGEQTLRIRSENLQNGIPVDAEKWREIQNLLAGGKKSGG